MTKRSMWLVGVAGVAAGLVLGAAIAALAPGAETAPRMQQREDQITIYSQGEVAPGTPAGPAFGTLLNSELILVAIDAADYPSSTIYRFEAVVSGGAQSTNYVRLFNETSGAEVAGSEVA